MPLRRSTPAAAASVVTLLLLTAAPAAVFAAVPASAAVVAPAEDVRTLLDGVGEIKAPGGLVATLTILDDANAFPVVFGKQGKDGRAPVVAAARAGQGRAVVYGHGNFIGGNGIKLPGNARLLANVVRWCAGGKGAAPRVLVVDAADTAAALRAAGFTAVNETKAEGIADALKADSCDVLIADMGEFEGAAGAGRIPAVQAFVRGGGGLVTATVGWGWQQMHPDASLSEDAGFNRLLVPLCAVGCDAGTADPTGAQQAFVADGADLSGYISAGAALARLEATGGPAPSPTEIAGISRAIGAALDVLPENDTRYLPRLHALMAKAGVAKGVVPTKAAPVTAAQPLERVAALLESRQIAKLPADKVTAHPAAANFPGAVPPAAEVPRVASRSIAVDTNVPAWHSTGLYAAPGEVVMITVPAAAVKKGLGIRIGAHKDTLWHLAKWPRFPAITREWRLDTAMVRVANAFGGTVFITVPDSGLGSKLGTVNVTVGGGVVEQPYFIKGKTTATEWAHLRDTPGPWAELQGDRVILTVPSSVVRHLDNPDALMAYWDQVADAAADLYAIPHERKRQERYCVDVEISAGYMHSGYPIMTHDDVAARFTDLSTLRAKGGNTWGFYHELGHNHQRPEWTWSGCGEVTNNLFSLYGGETFNDTYQKGDYPDSHGAVEPTTRRTRLVQYLAAGAPYDKWTSDPWIALTTFIGLRQAFGWEPFTAIFRDYESVSPSERPATDQEKRDQFLVRFSKKVGKNLAPYFTAFGIPITDAAKAQVASLPTWMPADWPTSTEIAAARQKQASR